MTTTELAALMLSCEDDQFEAAIDATGRMKITRTMSDDIEAVSAVAYDNGNAALETLCQLAQQGAARPARLVLAKCKRMGW